MVFLTNRCHHTTGLAENFVRTVKQALVKAEKSLSMESKVAKFLASYCNTPRVTTGATPAELLLKRLLCTHLSLLHPCVDHRMQTMAEQGIGGSQPRKFSECQSIALGNFCPNASTKCLLSSAQDR